MEFKTLISAPQLSILVKEGKALVLDCSFDLADTEAGRAAYGSSHIPGARYLHLDEDLAGPAGDCGRHPLPNPDLLVAALRRAGLNAGQQVVAYDTAGGMFASRLWWLLKWLRHDQVAVLDGGKQAWVDAGLELETDSPDTGSGNFTGSPDQTLVVDADAVLANLESRSFLVLDARAPERFAGHENPLDPVAGRIPGARNRFFKDNLTADGRFRTAAELAQGFEIVLGGISPDCAVVQCGSGVTACHNALALEIAGFRGVRLYPGSWSEWIAIPGRPVERD